MSNAISELSIPLRWPPSWTGVQRLELLKGTPVTCVLDAPPPIADAARSQGLTALTRDEAAGAVHFLPDPLWPGIRASHKDDSADAGPTGAPWVDANGWNIRLSQALNPGRPVWVEATPGKSTVQSDASYLLALAEATIYGARWVIHLDDAFAKGLAENDAALTARWRRMMGAAAFLEHRRSAPPAEFRSNLAVISAFTGDNEFLGKEFLNLADRRNLAYRVVPRQSAPTKFPSAAAAIVYIDEQAPDADLANKLKQFSNAGGLLIASQKSGASGWGGSAAASPIPGYQVKTLGKGSIAVPDEEWSDPYMLAAEVRILIGRRTDVLRLYNAGNVGALYSRAQNESAGTIHLLNYTRELSGDQISVAPADAYARAQVISLDHPSPQPLKISVRSERFNEIPVPAFTVYSAIELKGSKES